MLKKLSFAIFATVFVVLTVPSAGQQPDLVMAPKFEVDPDFPKELPKHWVTGMSVGVAVDEQDHVWMVHRPPTISPNERGADQTPPTGECCTAAPPIMEFDQSGTLLRHWGGQVEGAPYQWPLSNHGLWVDQKGFIWIGANHNTDSHSQVHERRRFVAQCGKPGQADSNDRRTSVHEKIQVVPKRNGPTSLTATQTNALSSSTPTRAAPSLLGRHGNKPTMQFGTVCAEQPTGSAGVPAP
jgi:hypothetical protein